MSPFGFPTLVERALRFSLWRAKSLGLACLLAVSVSGSLLGESLEKGPVYFYDRYGSQQSSKAVVGYKIYTPFKGQYVPIEEPCLIRVYNKEDVRLEVLYSDPKLEALWVRITLKEKFTDQSLAAALSAYGSGWKRLSSDSSVGIEIPVLYAKTVFQSEEGRLAFFFATTKQLMIYSTDAIEASKAYHQKRTEEQSKVPVF
ncbi:hypothetical protein [Pelagicoccus sp. SDUM812002]|uniref:hypothetical protein n=1 Tax=Pelagicoccus sp. SDUM812002 TaxID=3041266 RepID=UPI00280F1981|nr:hypothetical protein [Pelagicoccus sp. SDUM812002]MDQ8184295.1 hypothetical protein [Pelagicoccus sp. SDUM812002]